MRNCALFNIHIVDVASVYFPARAVNTPKQFIYIQNNTSLHINLIKLYLTDLRYTLKSFDIVIENAGEKTTIAEFRDNEETVLDINFEKMLVEKIHVICYKGDGEDYARIDQINAYLRQEILL